MLSSFFCHFPLLLDAFHFVCKCEDENGNLSFPRIDDGFCFQLRLTILQILVVYN